MTSWCRPRSPQNTEASTSTQALCSSEQRPTLREKMQARRIITSRYALPSLHSYEHIVKYMCRQIQVNINKPNPLDLFVEDERWRGAGDKETSEKARWWNSGGQETQKKQSTKVRVRFSFFFSASSQACCFSYFFHAQNISYFHKSV